MIGYSAQDFNSFKSSKLHNSCGSNTTFLHWEIIFTHSSEWMRQAGGPLSMKLPTNRKQYCHCDIFLTVIQIRDATAVFEMLLCPNIYNDSCFWKFVKHSKVVNGSGNPILLCISA